MHGDAASRLASGLMMTMSLIRVCIRASATVWLRVICSRLAWCTRRSMCRSARWSLRSGTGSSCRMSRRSTSHCAPWPAMRLRPVYSGGRMALDCTLRRRSVVSTVIGRPTGDVVSMRRSGPETRSSGFPLRRRRPRWRLLGQHHCCLRECDWRQCGLFDSYMPERRDEFRVTRKLLHQLGQRMRASHGRRQMARLDIG